MPGPVSGRKASIVNPNEAQPETGPGTFCFICDKHKNLQTYTGEVIAELGGLLILHFPIIEKKPATKGHLIIETKRHIEDLAEMNDEEAKALGVLTARSVKVLKKELGAEHVYMFRINDKAKHLHIHLVPRYAKTPAEKFGFAIFDWEGSPKVDLAGIQQVSNLLKKAFNH